jgi:hypothetical protein
MAKFHIDYTSEIFVTSECLSIFLSLTFYFINLTHMTESWKRSIQIHWKSWKKFRSQYLIEISNFLSGKCKVTPEGQILRKLI